MLQAMRGWWQWLWRRVPRPARDLGTRGERLAARMLRRHGYRVLARNVRLRVGEVDLVCEAPDRRTIVIVEVKTRCPDGTGTAAAARVPPQANVGAAKTRKLRALARALARANGWEGRPLRIDVVAVLWRRDGTASVRHFVNAVGG